MADFTGTAGEDFFVGTSINETIIGLGANDQLNGDAGDDTIQGGDGNDYLIGGIGADTIDGGAGDDVIISDKTPSAPYYIYNSLDQYSDTLTGGAGADTFRFYTYSSDSGNLGTLNFYDRITDFSIPDGDKIDLKADLIAQNTSRHLAFVGAIDNGSFSLTAGQTFSSIAAPELSGIYTWRSAGSTYVIVDLNGSNTLDDQDFVLALSGAVALTQGSFVSSSSFTYGQNVGTGGSSGSDTLSGSADGLVILGAGGDDTIHGGGARNYLDGGEGNDVITGGDDAYGDVLVGGMGSDILHGGEGGDILYAGKQGVDTIGGFNVLYGEGGADSLYGGAGYDTLYGGDGNDTIVANTGDVAYGGDGNDTLKGIYATLNGEGGDDTFQADDFGSVFTGGAGADRYTAYKIPTVLGWNTITDFNSAEGDRFDFGVSGTAFHAKPLVFHGALDNPNFSMTLGDVFSPTNDYGSSFLQIWTWTNGGDTYLIVDLDGRGALDYSDYVIKLQGAVTIDSTAFKPGTVLTDVGTNGNDIYNGAGEANTYYGFGGDDQLHGGGGDDMLYGGKGADTLWGDDGRDTLAGDEGDDILWGGAGDDFLVDDAGTDELHGGDGRDFMEAAATSGTGNTYYGDDGDDTIQGGTTAYNYVHGGIGNDQLTGGGELYGEDGNDTIRLYNVVGSIADGGAGADRLYGSNGDDTLRGGDGDDALDGGSGADLMTGGVGNDMFGVDNAGDQTIELAGEGVDQVRSSINWTLGANVEQLVLVNNALIGTGNELDNALSGNAKDNVLHGLAGADWMNGYTGNDTLYGDAGNDWLEGGDGNDLLDGGTGVDILIGGQGDDTYIVDELAEYLSEQAGQGVDQVRSSVNWVMGDNFEQLILTGSALYAMGNALGNAMVGNAENNGVSGGAGNDWISLSDGADSAFGEDGDDWLEGGSGNDILIGGAGNDVLVGGTGIDRFVFAPGAGHDIVTDFEHGDVLDLSGYAGSGVTWSFVVTSSQTQVQFSSGEIVDLLHYTAPLTSSDGYIYG